MVNCRGHARGMTQGVQTHRGNTQWPWLKQQNGCWRKTCPKNLKWKCTYQYVMRRSRLLLWSKSFGQCDWYFLIWALDLKCQNWKMTYLRKNVTSETLLDCQNAHLVQVSLNSEPKVKKYQQITKNESPRSLIDWHHFNLHRRTCLRPHGIPSYRE